tara:strand:- start:18323 stop:18940 length:618 start_codon:yes stop_codon:yes gene_type:complete
MAKTLNELITAAISGAEEDEARVTADLEPAVEEPAVAASSFDGDVEKIASALEFIGRRGIESFTKVADAPENNEGHLRKDTVDLKGKGLGDHNPALASNEAATNFDKKVKAKQVSDTLSEALSHTAFADPGLKKAVSNAAAKGDKNIHSKAASVNDTNEDEPENVVESTTEETTEKVASASDADLIRQALAAKIAEAKGDDNHVN